jgi:hypothetical protein
MAMKAQKREKEREIVCRIGSLILQEEEEEKGRRDAAARIEGTEAKN